MNQLLVKRTDGDVTGGYLPRQLGRSDWLRAGLDEALPVLGVGNPLPEFADSDVDRPGSLPFARAELESIAEMLPDGAPRVLYEHNATRQILLDALPDANLVHLSCHGRFRADDPLASGLLLADGELTLRDIIAAGFTALANTRLAVLSACQTSIQDFRNLPDEAIGLPVGFSPRFWAHSGVSTTPAQRF